MEATIPLDEFIALSRNNNQVTDLEGNIVKKNEAIAKIEADVKANQDRFKQHSERATEMKREASKLEHSIKDHESKIDETEKKQGDAKTNEEYSILTNKVKEEKAAISDIEDSLLTLFDDMESCKGELDTLKQEIDNNEADLKDDIVTEKNAAKTIEGEIEELKALQVSMLKSLPMDISALYSRIAKRYPENPVVLLKGRTCQGCYMLLNEQQRSIVIKAAEVTTCQSCQRILYSKE